jgi:sulfane dehydrogenase subunit SoxC
VRDPIFARREFLAGGVGLAGGLGSEGRTLGAPRRSYGERSPDERSRRLVRESATPGTGTSRTPLQDALGIITPSSLHFESHHSGVPALDAAEHELLVHGLVERPLALTRTELRRLPTVARIHFIECAGNSWQLHAGKAVSGVQESHGLVSCSEWTGVALRTLLNEVGVKAVARWVVAEGADASRHARSIPLEKAMDDALIAFGQNGEALRPEQGYPMRLVVPGWEGNVSVKWLRRLHVADAPAMTREEAATYTDFMPDGRARQFSFEMGVKSVVVWPSPGGRLGRRGLHEISGLAWSGRGRVIRVEVSLDGGSAWREANLEQHGQSKAFTRFTMPLRWSGEELLIQSRAWDESGARQPTRDEIVAARGLREGPDGFDHYNGIVGWRLRPDGEVFHG